ERGIGVRPVHLVEVDVVGAERPQALVDAAADPVPARVALDPAPRPRTQPALGRDDHLVARAARERLGEETLRGAEAVALRGVEDVDALVGGVADGGDRRLLVRGAPIAAQLPGPERD